jgi:STE24 endopeptidase
MKGGYIVYNVFYYAFIVICLLDFAWGGLLAALDRRRMRPAMPETLRGIYDEEEYARQQRYQAAYSRAEQCKRLVFALFYTAMLVFGGFGLFDLWLREQTEHFILLTLVYLACFSLAGGVLSLPFDLYDTFVIEARFGFNKTTPRLFVADLLKRTILYAVLGGAAIVAMLLLHRALGAWFWLPAWTVVSLFSLLFGYFYSELIVPLFNKQEALPEGELRRAIEAFAARAGFPLENIYVIDGSKRSTKANAYFTGFGGKKRVVLYDTLIADLTESEIVAVLAHEIGHYKKKHVRVSVALSLASSFILFLSLSFFVGQPAVARALGGDAPSLHLGLIGFSMMMLPLSMILRLIQNGVSRRSEYQADAFAAGYGLGAPLIEGLKKLSSKALVNLTPHPWVVFWRYSHPTLLARMARIEAGVGLGGDPPKSARG